MYLSYIRFRTYTYRCKNLFISKKVVFHISIEEPKKRFKWEKRVVLSNNSLFITRLLIIGVS